MGSCEAVGILVIGPALADPLHAERCQVGIGRRVGCIAGRSLFEQSPGLDERRPLQFVNETECLERQVIGREAVGPLAVRTRQFVGSQVRRDDRRDPQRDRVLHFEDTAERPVETIRPDHAAVVCQFHREAQGISLASQAAVQDVVRIEFAKGAA